MPEITPNSGNIALRVRTLAQPFAAELGLDLWDVRFLKEGVNWYLRLWIDKPGGVGLEDCEAMSRAIDAPLDEADFIPQFYFLEVCSPGIERELTREEHFAQYTGSQVRVRLQRPLEGQRELTAVLRAYESGNVTLELEDASEIVLPKKACTSIRLAEDVAQPEEEPAEEENI
ncbi:MAG: ribosome maturation factor RimP [Oscillospiraceae bacterium]|jgi:ribosome maturation factor RimP|nr:ribosome maturation factor RimP [Oscillospiraceae bacterium]